MNSEFENEKITEPQVEEVNGEITEEELFEDFSESVNVEQKIEIIPSDSSDEKSGRRGLKVFCLLIALTIIISSLTTGAYFIGKNQAVNRSLENKPEGVEWGDAASIYSSATESVVGVYIYNADQIFYSTSGIVYSEDGYIVTSDSTLDSAPAAKFKVMTADGKEYSAEFVGGDQRSDIAVLKIKESVNLKPAVLGNSDETVVGERVFAVGCANGYDEPAVLNEGIVSSASVRVTDSVTSYSAKRIQASITVNPSDFGGALLNEYCQVIGMLSTKIVATGYEQMAYAVPSAEIKNIAEQIINNGKVADRARIGISYIVKNAAAAEVEGLTTSGLLVADVDEESELFSLLRQNDIITELNGVRITKDEEVLDIIESLKPGDLIKLTVMSDDGSVKEHKVKLLGYKSESSYSALPSANGSDSADDSYEGY